MSQSIESSEKREIDVPLVRMWIAALRSGMYPQGTDCLLDTSGRYCCLGVLERLCGKRKDQLLGIPMPEEDTLKRTGLHRFQLDSVYHCALNEIIEHDGTVAVLHDLNDHGFAIVKARAILGATIGDADAAVYSISRALGRRDRVPFRLLMARLEITRGPDE